MMEVRIDRENCGNCMLCVEVCPEIFESRESQAEVLFDMVPPAFAEDCCTAALDCPTGAIELVGGT